MTIKTTNYSIIKEQWPQTGQHILAYQQNNSVVVYQAYNPQIADYAVANQQFGGPHYSYNRMSWIKPNFLWMMYRCGWASKENQERVLAIWISKNDFEHILSEAVFSTYNPVQYQNHEEWRNELNKKEVRLQWDPDHDPFGNKLNRRAIQLGMKGSVLENFGKRMVQKIEDVTAFVKEQHGNVHASRLHQLLVPAEDVYQVQDDNLKRKIAVQ